MHESSAGRFDREISLGVPSLAARRAILAVLTRGLRLAGTFDFDAVARATPGYVGADLAALTKEAAAAAVSRIFAQVSARDGGGAGSGGTTAGRGVAIEQGSGVDVEMATHDGAAAGPSGRKCNQWCRKRSATR